jgi:hypothetical protein
LSQLRDVFWVLNQVANRNSTHIGSMLTYERRGNGRVKFGLGEVGHDDWLA